MHIYVIGPLRLSGACKNPDQALRDAAWSGFTDSILISGCLSFDSRSFVSALPPVSHVSYLIHLMLPSAVPKTRLLSSPA